MGHSVPTNSREKRHLATGFFQKQIIFRMWFGRSIVGAATVAVASAATHAVHHPNQRTFHERQGFGAQADFQAGDAFGVNANVNLGNPLADNDFIMPIIVGLGLLSVLNIATDVLAHLGDITNMAPDAFGSEGVKAAADKFFEKVTGLLIAQGTPAKETKIQDLLDALMGEAPAETTAAPTTAAPTTAAPTPTPAPRR